MPKSLAVSAALIMSAGLLSACDTGPTKPTLNYNYGTYDSLVYSMYANPGEATPEVQIEKLAAEIEQTKSAGEPVPPGVHAHLGYMQYIAGNLNAARAEFDQERTAYPESAKFIDGISSKIGG